jgi:hypothetical protein
MKGETIELLPYCTDLPHVYDSEVEHNRHWAEEDNSSYLCQQETCPHRTNEITWPKGKWREEYYKPSERSKATEQRNPYHILGIKPMTIYTATQVNISNFNPPNVIPTIDTSANPQTVLPSQGMNVDTVLQQLCATLQLPIINANDLANLINQASGGGNPGGEGGYGGGGGGGAPPPPLPPQAEGTNPPDPNAIFNGLMNALRNMNEQEDIK